MKADIVEMARQLSTATWKLEQAEEDLANAKQRHKLAKKEVDDAVENISAVYRKSETKAA